MLYFFAAIAHSDITVVDYLDRSVTIKKPAQRIIALSPHIVENLFSAGAGDTLVGVVAHSDFPQQAKKIERIGGVNSFSLEKILSLSPDLVIIWASAARDNIVEQLSALDTPVYLDDPRSLADIARSIRDFGALTGRVKHSNKAADDYLSEIRRLQNQYQHQREKNIRVFYEVWNNPLQTISGKHIISDVIRLCGGHNIFNDALSLAPKINIETILERNPDIIFASNDKTRQEWLNYWQKWSGLNAVNYRRLHLIDPDFIQRHTVRIATGAKTMCQQIKEAATDGSG